jgi:xylose isomerase
MAQKKKKTTSRKKNDPYQPTPEDHFTFGIWAIGNVGRDPFGGPTRPQLSPAQVVELVGEAEGAYGVNFHDNDLVPLDATEQEAEQIKKDFRKALRRTGLKVPMATTNLFGDPVFKDGAFTNNDPEIRAYAIRKVMRGMALGAEFGAKTYVFWGGREGAECDATKDPVLAVQRMREAVNFLCKYNKERGFGYRFAFESKPNEPRGHLYMASTGSYLGFIPTLEHPEMCGVNPEWAHEMMSGHNPTHHVAQALDAGKLFHIDLNDQEPSRYDQDFRFGSVNYKHTFYLVKLLTDYKYKGMKHFDSKGFRTADWDDVKEFARGSMRSWKIMEEKVRRFHQDRQIQKLLKHIQKRESEAERAISKYNKTHVHALEKMHLDRTKLAERHLPYEELDQLIFDLITGAR